MFRSSPVSARTERLIRALSPFTDSSVSIVDRLAVATVIVALGGSGDTALFPPAVRVPRAGLFPDQGVHGGYAGRGHDVVAARDDVGFGLGWCGEGGGDGDGGFDVAVDRMDRGVLMISVCKEVCGLVVGR